MTVITVLRHFGSKDALFATVAREQTARPWRPLEAASPTPGGEAALSAVLAHFERYGGMILRLLREAERSPAIARAVASGRAAHAAWVDQTFGAALSRWPPGERRLRQAGLLAATHVQTWWLLRREQRLGRARARAVVERLVRAQLSG